MIEPNDTINTVTNPTEAVREFVGAQFIEWLLEYLKHDMAKWPVVTDLKKIETSPSKIKKFALQLSLAAAAFLGSDADPGFLNFAIGNLSESDDPEAESALEILEKRFEDERSRAAATVQSWTRLLMALGSTEEEITRTDSKEATRNYIAELSEIFSNSDWPTALGAIAAYDLSVAEEYRLISSLIQKNTLASPKDLEILTEHDNHSSVLELGYVLEKIVFDPENKKLIWDGAQKQLQARQGLLNGLTKYLH